MLRGLVRPRSGVDAEDVEDTDGLKHPRRDERSMALRVVSGWRFQAQTSWLHGCCSSARRGVEISGRMVSRLRCCRCNLGHLELQHEAGMPHREPCVRMPEHWDHLASLVAVHNSLNQSCGVGPTSGLPYVPT